MKALLAATLIALPTLALAHPHDDDPTKENETKLEAQADTPLKDSRTIIRLKRDMDGEQSEKVFTWDGDDFTWDSDEMKESARDFTALLADSEMATNMRDLLEELRGNIEVELGEDGTRAFIFDGEEMLRFKRDNTLDRDDRLSISGLGRNLTVERKTTKKDGQTLTRIVIEMDGGEDVDIDLPESDTE